MTQAHHWSIIAKRIEAIKNAGKTPRIDAVFIDYLKAKRFNSFRERSVPEDILRETHKGYRENLKRLLTEYPDIDVRFTVNTGTMKDGVPETYIVPKKQIQGFLNATNDL